MIDFHTHILPAVDDGSKDIEMTRQMLEMESSMGVRHVVATPHFYAHRMSVEDFIKRRTESFEGIKHMSGIDGLPEITMGAEVYYFEGIGNADKLPELAIEGTQSLLVEMPFSHWDEHVYRDIDNLIDHKGYRVILAHIERYPEFQKRQMFGKSVLERVLELPLIFQINASSFYIDKKRLRFCSRLIESGADIIIGSDCHNVTIRKPDIELAKSYIISEFGEPIFNEMQRLAREVSGL